MAEEVVCLVDENNNVTGAGPRSQMRAEKLRHRATYILVFNSRGRSRGKRRQPGCGSEQLYVQRHTMTKGVSSAR